jgi:hypothetical protein
MPDETRGGEAARGVGSRPSGIPCEGPASPSRVRRRRQEPGRRRSQGGLLTSEPALYCLHSVPSSCGGPSAAGRRRQPSSCRPRSSGRAQRCASRNRNPARARALLATAGHAAGLEVRLDGPRNRYVSGVAILDELARQLGATSVRATFNAIDKREFFSLIEAGPIGSPPARLRRASRVTPGTSWVHFCTPRRGVGSAASTPSASRTGCWTSASRRPTGRGRTPSGPGA